MPPKTAKTVPRRTATTESTTTNSETATYSFNPETKNANFPPTHHPDELFTQSESTKNLMQAIGGFQKDIRFVSQDSQGYGYNYASLPAIIETIDPFLEKHNLLISQLPHSLGSNVGVLTILIHGKSGEWIRKAFTVPLPLVKGTNSAQAAGSAITYCRRYAIASILGLIVDPDLDAN